MVLRSFLRGVGARFVGATVVVLVLVGVLVAGMVEVASAAPATPASSARASRYVPVASARLLDTRLVAKGRLAAGTSIVVSVPSTAEQVLTAAVVNVTAVDAGGPGFVSVYPGGAARPNSSSVNAERVGHTVANLVTVQLGSDGALAVFTSFDTDLVIDLVGVYEQVASSSAGRFVRVPPTRAFDSRNVRAALGVGETVRVNLGSVVPATATVAVLNLTAVDAAAGFWTATAGGLSRPATSNLNVTAAGDTVANQAYVPVVDGAIDVYSEHGGHLIVDVVGFITGDQDAPSREGLFVPITPSRIIDTRAEGELNPVADRFKPRADSTWEVLAGRDVVPFSASAAALNVTVAHANAAGFVTVWPAGSERPDISNVNTSHAGQLTANHVVVAVALRGIALRASTSTHLVVDVTGWFIGKPTLTAIKYQPNDIEKVSGRLRIPKIRMDQALGDGLDDITLDRGPMHWTFSVLPGEVGTTMLLGHRSSHTAPFYRIGELVPGDAIVVEDGNGRHEYRVTSSEVRRPDELLGLVDDTTANLMLVACHPIGSTLRRLVVHAVLV
jgi:LPXTG-site transpeptidase (sortase) family protein